VLVAAFLILEVAVRQMGYRLPPWYPALAQDQSWRTADHRMVLVGTSRVFAAIDETAVMRTLSTQTTRAAVANMGQGFSSLVTHALGLRLLADEGLLQGATVVVEAPAGLADPLDWRDPWYLPERPQWLVSVMRARDIPALWWSHTPWEDTLGATARTLFGASVLSRYREDVRSAVIAQAAGVVPRTPQGASSTGQSGTSAMVLPAQRSDTDLERIRDVAVVEGQRWTAASRDVVWETTVVASIVAWVQAAGGRVVFADMPLSTPMAAGLQTMQTRRNRKTFRQSAARWGVVVITPDVRVTDDDFPDLWHVSVDARARYTQALMNAWVSEPRTR
jgi:hypothetical protein